MHKESEVVRVPATVVATSPFTNIVLDDNDHLNATLEQVNRNTYDRLKLCRTTMTVDGGVAALPNMGVILSYTGAFLFPRMKGVDKPTVIGSVNQVLLHLMFGGIRFDAVSPDDVGHGMVYGTGCFLASGGASGANYRSLMALQHQDTSSFDAIKLIEPRTFTKRQVADAIVKGKPLVEKLPELNPSMFLDGITHYKQFQLASALNFLWSIAESLIGRIWTEKVVPAGTGIPGRKDFVESHAWQAAFKAEVLFQVGAIDERLYGMLNEARHARNALSHRGKTPTLAACERALEASFALMSLVVTNYARSDEFAPLIESLKEVHKPHSGPLEPKFWRDISAVPGDEKWGDTPYPRHPEIELVPVKALADRNPRSG
jgi:hypothetical protein